MHIKSIFYTYHCVQHYILLY